MRGQLLLLRLLNTRRSLSTLTRIVPSDPTPLGFSPRFFSSRPIRSRGGGGGGGRNPEFSRNRGPRRGEFELENFGRRGGGSQTKSLIEDEAELSDWVSDLKTDSIRVGLSSESEDSDRDNKGRARVSGRDRSSDRDSFSSMKNQRGGRGGRDRFSISKRRGESDSDDLITSRSSRGGSNGSFSRNSRGSMSGIASKRKFDSDDDEDEDLSLRRQSGHGPRGGWNGSFSRNSRGSMSGIALKRKFDSDDDDEKEDISLRRQRGHGPRGGFSPPTNRGGRGSDLSSGRGRQGSRGGRSSDLSYGRDREGGGMSLGRQAVKILEDDDEDGDDDDDEDVISDSEEELLSGEDGEETFVKDERSLPELAKEDSLQPTLRISAGENDSYLSQTRFDQCSISPLSLKGIKAAGYEKMTVVQEATLPVILKGKDVLAKAKTGTGKTVAFLLPAIEAVVKLPPPDRDQKRPPINVLVICPTRELASQAAVEADTLLKYHPSIGVQVVIGGTRLALEQKRMQANPCQILVATPGRLRDHIENTAGFATRLMGVKVLVLDEADHMLDMGFRKEIEKIIAAVPKQRQTLLFSATVPEEVRQICYIALKRDHEFINTVVEGSEETHSQVRQMLIVTPLEKQFSILYRILTDHISEDADYKVLVFCTSAMVTRLVAELLSELTLNVREIHSRKPQSYRTRVSDEFRKSKGLILVTSDVSARGVDYPNVTLVIQVGLPADREQYIHRLGRTGRKGKEGQGILLLAPWEEFFLTSLKDLPITKSAVPAIDPDTRKKVERALSHVEVMDKAAAYQAWLGYYNSNKYIGRDKYKLVELANEFSRSMGLDNPPAIPKLILGKMRLRNIPGLRAK